MTGTVSDISSTVANQVVYDVSQNIYLNLGTVSINLDRMGQKYKTELGLKFFLNEITKMSKILSLEMLKEWNLG